MMAAAHPADQLVACFLNACPEWREHSRWDDNRGMMLTTQGLDGFCGWLLMNDLTTPDKVANLRQAMRRAVDRVKTESN